MGKGFHSPKTGEGFTQRERDPRRSGHSTTGVHFIKDFISFTCTSLIQNMELNKRLFFLFLHNRPKKIFSQKLQVNKAAEAAVLIYGGF